MNDVLKYYITIFLLGTLFSGPSYAQQDEVHFGTIFVEDIEYENSEDNQSINHLTDQSSKQQQLETLYKQEIGLPNAQLKKLNAEKSRAPASKDSKDSKSLQLGVVRNEQLPKQIVYFIELRSFEGNQSTLVHETASPSSQPVIRLQPGELLKVVDTPYQYVHKMRMDRDNQGLWKSITTREQDIQNPQVYYDWRNFETITSHDFPVEMDIMVPYGRNSIPIFSKPGAWTWRDCGLTENLCKDNIDIHTKAYLFDVTIVDTRPTEDDISEHKLFYKLGYQVRDKNGNIQHRVGWLPSHHAKRKISQLPKSLLATRDPSSFGTFESDAERLKRLQKYYVFDSNMNSTARNMSRWLNSTPGNSTEVFFQNIAIDGIANYSHFSLEQDFNIQTEGEAFTQQGITVGAGIFAPIFIDLEIQGTVAFTIPIEANETNVYQKSTLFRGEQWLLYTTPLTLSDLPFKFGVGAYYLTMFSTGDNFGFNALVGFQGKALLESDTFWASFRYGPTGQDFGFSFENREIGFDIGYRLNPERGYESWTIFGDLSDTNFTSGETDFRTQFQIISLGVRKQF
jgi:hypothetical protein